MLNLLFEFCHLIGLHCLGGPGFSKRIVKYKSLSFCQGSRVTCRGSHVEGRGSELCFFQMSQIVGVVNRRLVNPNHYIEVCLLCH